MPEVLSLVGERLGQSELYEMLLSVAPDLASTVDRKAIIKQMIAENTAALASLPAEYALKASALRDEVRELNKELASFTGGNQPMIEVVGRKDDLERKRTENVLQIADLAAENSVRIAALVDDNFSINQELASTESAEANRMMQRITSLAAELQELSKALATVGFAETDQPMEDENELAGRKRGRGE